jgi:hypothetical protein
MVQGMQKFQTVGKLWRKTAGYQMCKMSDATKRKVCHHQEIRRRTQSLEQPEEHPYRRIFSEEKLKNNNNDKPFVYSTRGISILEMNISVSYMIFVWVIFSDDDDLFCLSHLCSG